MASFCYTDAVATTIASCALNHYHQVLPPCKGKPKENEWTVYAALVAVMEDEDERSTNDDESKTKRDEDSSTLSRTRQCCWVVSCATGTKCTSTTSATAAAHHHHHNCNTIHGDNGEKDDKGWILHDSHAEVLTRRGFMRVLWQEIIEQLSKSSNKGDKEEERDLTKGENTTITTELCNHDGYRPLLERIPHRKNDDGKDDDYGDDDDTEKKNQSTTNSITFQLRRNIKLHLYVSDSPCGDASIYPIHTRSMTLSTTAAAAVAATPPEQHDDYHPMLRYTGAKVIVSQRTGVKLAACGGGGGGRERQIYDNYHHHCSDGDDDDTNHPPISLAPPSSLFCLAREDIQLVGKLRTKSGRSNVDPSRRSTSMSCSDKLVRWNVLGLQGTMLHKYIPQPMVLSSVVVSRDPAAACATTITTTRDADAQLEALERAIPQRVRQVWQHVSLSSSQERHQPSPPPAVPQVYIVPDIFDQSKAAVEYKVAMTTTNVSTTTTKLEPLTPPTAKKRKPSGDQSSSQPTKYSSCGMSLNWQQTTRILPSSDRHDVNHHHHHRHHRPRRQDNNKHDKNRGMVELVVGARGIQQGKKPKAWSDHQQLASRLSQWSLQQLSKEVDELIAKKKDERKKQLSSAANNTTAPSSLPTITHGEHDHDCRSYQDWKRHHATTQQLELRCMVLEGDGSPLSGWLQGSSS